MLLARPHVLPPSFSNWSTATKKSSAAGTFLASVAECRTAVRNDELAGDEARRLRRQKYRDASDIHGLTDSPQGRTLLDTLQNCRI